MKFAAGIPLAVGVSVYAAVPAGVTTAITAYETDAITVYQALIAAGIAIFAVRKLGQKMGWL